MHYKAIIFSISACLLLGLLPSKVTASEYDIDGNGEEDALTDGLLFLRHEFGLTGTTLTTGALASDATANNPESIANYIDQRTTVFDLDGNGSTDALTDGLLLLRHLFGLSGDAMTNGVIGLDATRINYEQIKSHIDTERNPSTPGNKRPFFTSSSSFDVEENQTVIGTVIATDSDGDNISYSVSGDDASAVNIDPSSGAMSFLIPADYESVQSYSIKAVASDGIDETTQNISIVITNIPPPTLSEVAISGTYNDGQSEELLFLSKNGKVFSGRTSHNGAVDKLIASFEYTGSSVSIDGVVQESGITVNDFTDIVPYTVTNSDGDIENFTVDLTRFTGLPIVYLKTDGSVGIDSKDDYVEGDTSIVGGRNFDDLEEVEMKIRGRGNSTWMHPKKPFQMKLEDKAEFLGMPNDKKWLFLAEYSDKTLLRNKISFEMGYLSNLDWTPQGRFAEVYINNQYNGTYHVTQKVEETNNRVPLGDTGYLLEIDHPDRIDADEDVYFDSVMDDRYFDTCPSGRFLINIKEPSLDYDSAEFTYIKDLIADFERSLFSTRFLSEADGYLNHIDVNSFVDWYLISEITKNVDSKCFSSIFLNVMPGEKIKMGPLWDFDLSFGNVDYADSRYAEGWWVKYHPWYYRLFEDPAFVELVKARFAYFRGNQDLILEKIDTYAEQLQWSQQENDDLWQTIGVFVWPNPVAFDTYQEEVDHMKMWFRNRMDWLDDAINNLTNDLGDDGQTAIIHAIPGLIQAEDFSAMEGIQVESTGDVGGGSNVGYISAGDWLEYTIDVSSAGSYLLEYRVASSGGTNGFEVLVDGVQVDSQSIPDTGGWQSWVTISAVFELSAGNQVLRLNAVDDSWNINWIDVTTQ